MNIKKYLKERNIAVLYGGRSSEREISLLTGKAILNSLLSMGFNAVAIDVNKDVAVNLRKNKIDLVFNALHGPWGEDGTMQGMLEMMDIKYTGCGVLSSALAMNKIYSKIVFESANIPTPKWAVVKSVEDLKKIKKMRGLLVVKPASQGSAIAVTIVRNNGELAPAIQKALRKDNEVIVEEYVSGTEITVGILGNKALPAIEISPENEFYDFDAKYTPGKSKHIMPPRLSPKVIQKSQSIALAAFKALKCKAVSRIDLIVDKNNHPWVLEVNTIPGMTETSLLPDAARAEGMNFDELVLKIAEYSVAG